MQKANIFVRSVASVGFLSLPTPVEDGRQGMCRSRISLLTTSTLDKEDRSSVVNYFRAKVVALEPSHKKLTTLFMQYMEKCWQFLVDFVLYLLSLQPHTTLQ